MSTATLALTAAAFRTLAGTVNTSNGGDTGYWREIALAAESLAGAATTANAHELGYMLRTALALESIEGTSGAEENRNYPGLLKRIVDAMEAGNGVVNTGSLEQRLYLASLVYEGGIVNLRQFVVADMLVSLNQDGGRQYVLPSGVIIRES